MCVKVIASLAFHTCLFSRFPVLHVGAAFSSSAFFSPAVWCRVFQSCVFQSCSVDCAVFSGLAFSVPPRNIVTAQHSFLIGASSSPFSWKSPITHFDIIIMTTFIIQHIPLPFHSTRSTSTYQYEFRWRITDTKQNVLRFCCSFSVHVPILTITGTAYALHTNHNIALIIMVALWNRADRYIFALWFLSSFFFFLFFLA